jgi:hypothetical protein
LTDEGFPLSLIHPELGTSRRLYTWFVNDGIAMGHKEELYLSPSMSCLGEQFFVNDYQERVKKKTNTDVEKVKLISIERLVTGLRERMPVEIL